jgi:hypothetical protein
MENNVKSDMLRGYFALADVALQYRETLRRGCALVSVCPCGGGVWCGVVWCGVVWCGVVWCVVCGVCCGV